MDEKPNKQRSRKLRRKLARRSPQARAERQARRRHDLKISPLPPPALEPMWIRRVRLRNERTSKP